MTERELLCLIVGYIIGTPIARWAIDKWLNRKGR